MTKIKLCGLTREADIDAANLLRPDYIGFVFAKSSRRAITPEQAAERKAALHQDILAVGVFVNEPTEHILQLLEAGTIDIAQLHGAESFDDVSALKRQTQKPVIQAFRVTRREDVLRAIQSPADYILLDNGAGGTGERFDWSLVEGIRRDFFLAGGLSASNVQEAISCCQPFAVDTSSALETDGVKDFAKMAAFVAAARAAK